jgi:glycosyltransferase involved in cell wall biosynthesis
MKLLVDGTAFENAHQLGIQRYFRELLARIARRNHVTVWNQFPPRTDLPEGCLRIGPDLREPPRRRNVLARAKRRLLRDLRALRRPGYEVFCSTYYTRSPHPDIPEVVVVHDMIHEHFVETHLDAEQEIAKKRKAILNARICIAISQATAADLKAFYPGIAERVRVIYHGVDHLLAAARTATVSGIAPTHMHGQKYVLFVGARSFYKNFTVVLEALAHPDWPAGVKLAVVGKTFSEGERLLIQKMGVTAAIIEAGPVNDAQLGKWYAGAVGLVFPSLAEGFGFPSLEAQCFGTPVACSDIPVFREICGGGAVYFEPRSPASLARAVASLLESDVRGRLRERAAVNVHRFSWDRCAEETHAVLAEAATYSSRG